MTYLDFHYYFILPPIFILLALYSKIFGFAFFSKKYIFGLVIMAFMAVVYTTPWDNYLVFKKVWWYGQDKVMGVLGYVPIEEYMFFVLQTILSGLFFYILFNLMFRHKKSEFAETKRFRSTKIFFFSLLVIGIFFLTKAKFLYLGLIMVWSIPVMLIQLFFGVDLIVKHFRMIALAVLIPTIYLAIADRIAISRGIWALSKEYTTGLFIAGLPIEELLFFLVTNIMVVFGLFLFIHPDSPKRLKALLS